MSNRDTGSSKVNTFSQASRTHSMQWKYLWFVWQTMQYLNINVNVDVDVDGLRTKPSGCSPIQYWSFVLLDTLYSWQSVWRSSFWCAHATAHFDWKFCRRQIVQTDLNVISGCSVGYWFVSEGEGLDWPLTQSYVCLKMVWLLFTNVIVWCEWW